MRKLWSVQHFLLLAMNLANLLTGVGDKSALTFRSGDAMTASTTNILKNKTQQDMSAARTAAAAAGKAVTEATAKVARTAIDANRAVSVVAGKALSSAAARTAKAATDANVAALTKTATKIATEAGHTATKVVTEAGNTATRIVTEATAAAAGSAVNTAESMEPAFAAVTKQAQDVLGTLASQTKELTLSMLDAWESVFAAALDMRRNMIDATQVEAMSSWSEATSKAMTEAGATYSQAVRQLLQ